MVSGHGFSAAKSSYISTGKAGQMEQKRRRYYTVSQNARLNEYDYKFVNKADALVESIFPGAYTTQGSHEFVFPGHTYTLHLGLPTLRERPRIKIGLTRKPIDIYELESGLFFISTRAKLLLESIDKEGFEFFECETMDRRGQPTETYWMMAVIRAVADFDRARSNFVTCRQQNPNRPDFDVNDRIFQLNDIYMPKDFNDSWHVFLIYKGTNQIIMDEVIVDAWRHNKFNSWFFTPLQPPMKNEYKRDDFWYFSNSRYWTEKEFG
jgi:hypothetical protein